MSRPDECPICGDEFVAAMILTAPLDAVSDPYAKGLARQGLEKLSFERCAACNSVVAVDARRNGSLASIAYDDLPEQYWDGLADGASLATKIKKLVAGRASAELWDVGCGDGALLRHLRGDAPVHGIEPGAAAARRANAAGLDVRTGTASSLALCEVADVVTCVDVIEHLDEPLVELRAMFDMLKPGGHFVGLTGAADSLAARVAGEDWYYLRVGGHVGVPSGAGAIALLARAGFVGISTRTWNHPGAVSAARWARRQAGNVLRSALGKPHAAVPFFHDHQLIVARRR